MIVGNPILADFLYNEILIKDVYGLRPYPPDYFDAIADVGANVGTFSVYARMHHPKARIVAFEPWSETYDILRLNVSGLKIDTRQVALGNGSALHCWPGKHHGCNTFMETPYHNLPPVQSMRLTQLLLSENIGPSLTYMVKIDCEGGERFLLDGEADDVILGAAHVAIEFHYSDNNYGYFSKMPNRAQYQDWLKKFDGQFERNVTDANLDVGNETIVMQRRDSGT